jgi:hypothetical protein
MDRVASFKGPEYQREFADLAGDVEAIKQRALELARPKFIKTFDKIIAAREVAVGAASLPPEKRQRSEPKKLVQQGFKPNHQEICSAPHSWPTQCRIYGAIVLQLHGVCELGEAVLYPQAGACVSGCCCLFVFGSADPYLCCASMLDSYQLSLLR